MSCIQEYDLGTAGRCHVNSSVPDLTITALSSVTGIYVWDFQKHKHRFSSLSELSVPIVNMRHHSTHRSWLKLCLYVDITHKIAKLQYVKLSKHVCIQYWILSTLWVLQVKGNQWVNIQVHKWTELQTSTFWKGQYSFFVFICHSCLFDNKGKKKWLLMMSGGKQFVDGIGQIWTVFIYFFFLNPRRLHNFQNTAFLFVYYIYTLVLNADFEVMLAISKCSNFADNCQLPIDTFGIYKPKDVMFQPLLNQWKWVLFV